MTEYDYSPEAYDRYLATQSRISKWVDHTQQYKDQFVVPFDSVASSSSSRSAPATPYPRSTQGAPSYHGDAHHSSHPRGVYQPQVQPAYPYQFTPPPPPPMVLQPPPMPRRSSHHSSSRHSTRRSDTSHTPRTPYVVTPPSSSCQIQYPGGGGYIIIPPKGQTVQVVYVPRR